MATKSAKPTKSTSRRKALPLPAGLPVRNILVPIDLSDLANEALAYAVELARNFGAKLTLLHVIERPGYYPYAEGGLLYPGFESIEEVVKSAQKKVKQISKQHHLDASILEATLVEIGVPFQAVVDTAEARAVDLIILSTHGRTGIAHVFMGSTAERVVRHASCPVLVVRPQKTSADD